MKMPLKKTKLCLSERINCMIITIEEVQISEAINAVRKTIELVGNIKFIEHRYANECYGYETAFNGINGSIIVKGGFSSGYQGEGPQGLKKRYLQNLDLMKHSLNRMLIVLEGDSH